MAQDKPTLCWKCEKACGRCSWSADFIPVDGWDAMPTIVTADRGHSCERELESFIVKKCPLFNDDTQRYKSSPVFYGEKKPFVQRTRKTRTIKGSLRERIWNLPDLDERIDRLDGADKTAAELVFRYNNTLEDVADYMYYSIDHAKAVLQKVMEKMEAMA